MKIDPNCRYRSSHEYVRKDGSEFVVGISDHAQEALGDIVFVELVEVGATVAQGEAIGVVESVKAASDIYAPVSGKVIAVNDALDTTPELVNESAEEGAWMAEIEIADAAELQNLMTREQYDAYLKTL